MNFELDDLTKQLQKDPKNSSLLIELGSYYLTNGYYKQAKDEYHLASLFSPRLISQVMINYEKMLDKNFLDIQARLSLVSFCLANNDLDSATLELEELLEVDSQNLQAYNLLGKIFILKDKIDEAMSLLENALKNGVKDITISEMLASVYLEKKRYEEAISFYEELPADKKNLRTLAELYQRIKNYEKSAEKYYQMYVSDSEVAPEVQMKLEELLMKNIASVKIREYLAELYAKSMKPDLAVKKLSEIIKISPEKSDEITAKIKQLLKNYPLNPDATFALTEMLSEKGDYSEAIEEYYQIIKTKPDLTDKAIEGCRKIIEKYPNQFLARQFLVETYLDQGKQEEAISEIKQLLKTYPDTAEWIITKGKEYVKKYPKLRECLGLAYILKGDFVHANLEAENLLMQDRASMPALLLLSEIYLKQKLCRKAAETLNKALAQEPYNKEVHSRFKEAKQKELELEAEQLKKRIIEDEWKISLHLDLGKIYLQLGQKEEALRELQISGRDTQKAANVYYILGNFYLNEGLYDQSLDAFRKAMQFAGAEANDLLKKIKFKMTQTFEAQGNLRQSIKLLEEIEQDDIDFPGLRAKLKYLKNSSLSSIQNKMLVLLIKTQDKADAIGTWGRETKKAAALRQNLSVSFGQNYNNSGIQYFLKSMNEAAEEEFTLAVQLDPNYTVGVNNLAASQILNKKFTEAYMRLKEAHDADPASAIILNNLGVVLYMQGAYNEAEEKFAKALQIDPELTVAKINRADMLYKIGKVKEALSLYQEIQPYDFTADIAEQRLQYKLV